MVIISRNTVTRAINMLQEANAKIGKAQSDIHDNKVPDGNKAELNTYFQNCISENCEMIDALKKLQANDGIHIILK